MIAVLPFENLGPAEDEYFADGVTEEITSRLAAVHGLGVISRTSAMQYKERRPSLRQIGEELGVAYVLEGTVRWERRAEGPSRVRVTPQLIRVADDTHLWSERYDEELEEIFAVQSSIAVQVIEQLKVTLLEPARRLVEAVPTENLEAYQAYLRGLSCLEKPFIFDEENNRLAVEMFERSVELDPELALAHAGLSEVHSRLYRAGHDRAEESLAEARRAAERALELAPELPRPHYAMALYHYWGRLDYERALDELRVAEEILPSDAQVVATMGWIRRRQGRFEEALTLLRRAIELNPRHVQVSLGLAVTYGIVRRYEEAERYYDRSISLAPNDWVDYVYKAYNSWLWMGDTQSARATLEAAPHDHFPTVFGWADLETYERDYQAAFDRLASAPVESAQDYANKLRREGYVHLFMNEPERARVPLEAARSLYEKLAEEQPDYSPWHSDLGMVYAGLGRKEEAIREGELAVELLPVSKDASRGPEHVSNLAVIYAWSGEHDLALDRIEYLLSIPAGFYTSVPYLRIDPLWDPLRDNPRFRELLER